MIGIKQSKLLDKMLEDFRPLDRNRKSIKNNPEKDQIGANKNN